MCASGSSCIKEFHIFLVHFQSSQNTYMGFCSRYSFLRVFRLQTRIAYIWNAESKIVEVSCRKIDKSSWIKPRRNSQFILSVRWIGFEVPFQQFRNLLSCFRRANRPWSHFSILRACVFSIHVCRHLWEMFALSCWYMNFLEKKRKNFKTKEKQYRSIQCPIE